MARINQSRTSKAFVSIPKRVSEVLWRAFYLPFNHRQLVSIPKRVSEVLWQKACAFHLSLGLVSIPKRVSEVLWLEIQVRQNVLLESFNP